jgi:hypothetical protein
MERHMREQASSARDPHPLSKQGLLFPSHHPWFFLHGYALLTYNFLLQRDVLKATLKSGVLVKKYVPTYGELPNDVENVTKCQFLAVLETAFGAQPSPISFIADFKEKFRAYHVRSSFRITLLDSGV